MRIKREDLRNMVVAAPPPPAPIAPLLSPEQEARVIVDATDGTAELRAARVRSIIRRAATPTGDDAELLVRLALSRSLPVEDRDDYLKARQRLVGIGADPGAPNFIHDTVRRYGLKLGDGVALADALLGRERDFKMHSNPTEPNWSANGGAWGG